MYCVLLTQIAIEYCQSFFFLLAKKCCILSDDVLNRVGISLSDYKTIFRVLMELVILQLLYEFRSHYTVDIIFSA